MLSEILEVDTELSFVWVAARHHSLDNFQRVASAVGTLCAVEASGLEVGAVGAVAPTVVPRPASFRHEDIGRLLEPEYGTGYFSHFFDAPVAIVEGHMKV
jgi:hypothetical protein